ncbi:MAG: TPM domain-containing protein [Bacteroidetes bacterium]|nr:TPM domain-containing protein [Bacteroidota bacterium]
MAIQDAIGMAEKKTSGEVRVYIESKCSYINAADRAAELFLQLEMHKTAARNGVLFYLAIKDRQIAIWGDQGIHEKLGTAFWQLQVDRIISAFQAKDPTLGICLAIQEIGAALHTHFPYEGDKDKNELSDELSFGR